MAKALAFPGYDRLLRGVAEITGDGRRQAAWSLNAVMSAVYWDIFQTVSGKSLPPEIRQRSAAFILPWSHYARLLSLSSEAARKFYQTEALRGGWSFRQLDRQIGAQLYERLALSRDKAALLRKTGKASRAAFLEAEEEIREPYILEFLDLKDKYSESDLEENLIRHLEQFLIELGSDFCFVGRQRRLRIGGEWYRVDLLFFHRKLRCLVIIDLKVGKFTHADAGQMHLYCNYANEARLAAEIEKTRELLESRSRKRFAGPGAKS